MDGRNASINCSRSRAPPCLAAITISRSRRIERCPTEVPDRVRREREKCDWAGASRRGAVRAGLEVGLVMVRNLPLRTATRAWARSTISRGQPHNDSWAGPGLVLPARRSIARTRRPDVTHEEGLNGRVMAGASGGSRHSEPWSGRAMDASRSLQPARAASGTEVAADRRDRCLITGVVAVAAPIHHLGHDRAVHRLDPRLRGRDDRGSTPSCVAQSFTASTPCD